MDKQVLFYSFTKETGIIEGVSEDIEIENTATGLVTAPILAFKLPESEVIRFSKERNLVYDAENKNWTFSDGKPLINFKNCISSPNQEYVNGNELYLAEAYQFLS